MKKKLLSLIIAMVTLMTLAIVVNAAETPKVTYSVAGLTLNAAGDEFESFKDVTKDASETSTDLGTITIAEGVSVTVKTVSTSAKTGEKVTITSVGVESNDTNSVTVTGTAASATIKAVDDNTTAATVTIKYKATYGTAKDEEHTATLKVKVVPVNIIKDSLVVNTTRTSAEGGKATTSKVVMSKGMDKAYFYVGDKVSIDSATVVYNDNKTAKSVDIGKLTHTLVTDIFSKAGDPALTFTYTPGGGYTVQTFTANVTVENRVLKITGIEKNPEYTSSNEFKSVYTEGDEFEWKSIRLVITEQGTNTQYHAYVDGYSVKNDPYAVVEAFTVKSYGESNKMSTKTDAFVLTYNTVDYTFNFKKDLGVTTVANVTLTPYSYDGKLIKDMTNADLIVVLKDKVFDFSKLVIEVTDKKSGAVSYIKSNQYTGEVYSAIKAFDTYRFNKDPLNRIASEYTRIKVVYNGVEYPSDDITSTIEGKDYKFAGWTLGQCGTRYASSVTAVAVDIYPTFDYTKTYTAGSTIFDYGYKLLVTFSDGKTLTLANTNDANLVVPAFQLNWNKEMIIKYLNADGTSADLILGKKGVDKEFIKVEARTLSKLIVTVPSGTLKIGDTIDYSKISIKAVYNNGQTSDLKYNADGLQCFPANGTKITSESTDLVIVYTENGVTQTANATLKAALVPTKIEVSGYKTTYLVGEIPSLTKDITTITVTKSDGSVTSFTGAGAVAAGGFKFTSDNQSVGKISKESTKMVVSYTLNNVEVKTEYAIKVENPAVILTTDVETPYATFEEALAAANESDAAKRTITLQQDVVMLEKHQFNADKSIMIDLNGKSLTMEEGQLYVPHNDSHKDVVITLANTANNDATIVYSADKKITLSKGDMIQITYQTETAGVYHVTITVGDNGTVTGPTEIIHGNNAEYKITPNEGFEVADVVVDGKSVGAVTTYTIKAIAADHAINVTFKAAAKDWNNPFTDVSKYADYYSAIQFVYENGLFNGMSATTFEPNTTMTRAMYVTVLGRLSGIDVNDARYAGKVSYDDIKLDNTTSWYTTYVEWASQVGLLKGYEDGTFRPNREISHEEMYILMERYARYLLGVTSTATSTTVNATDRADIPTWEGAYEAVQFATKYDFVVYGANNKITPNDFAYRYELAQCLEKFCAAFGIDLSK